MNYIKTILQQVLFIFAVASGVLLLIVAFCEVAFYVQNKARDRSDT